MLSGFFLGKSLEHSMMNLEKDSGGSVFIDSPRFPAQGATAVFTGASLSRS